jgi:hypothetical protein
MRKVLSALIVFAVLCLYSWSAGIVFLSFASAYLYLGRKFSSAILETRALLLVVTTFTYTAALGLLILISSSISNVTLNTVLLIDLLIFILLLLYESFSLRSKPVTRKLVSSGDIASLIVAIIAFYLLGVMPLLSLSAQSQHGNVLALITGNVDNASHLAIFNDYLGFGNTQIWNEHTASRGKADGFYPSSWHGANATITHAIDPSLRPGNDSAAIFGFISVFWISLLVFMVSRYAFTIYRLITKKQTRTTLYLTIPLLTLTSFYFFFVHILRFGFFSYTPQLIAAIILMYCLHQVLREKLGSKSGLGLAVLYCAISLASWVLLLPVALGATILAVLATYSKQPLRKAPLVTELKSSWPLFMLSGLSMIAQLWLMHSVKSASSIGLGSGLLLDGGAPVYSTFIYIVLFIGLGSAILYARRIKQLDFYKPVLLTSIITVLFAGALFMYQVYYTSTTHYYYYKSVWLLPTILSPIGMAMAAVYIDNVKDRLFAVLAALTLPFLLIQFLPSDTSVLAFMRGSRVVSSAIDQSMWLEMYKNAYPTNRVTIYFVNSGTAEASVTSTLLVAADRPYSSCFESLSNKIVYQDTDVALRNIISKLPPSICKGKHIVLEVDPSYRKIIKDGVHSNSYTVRFLNV